MDETQPDEAQLTPEAEDENVPIPRWQTLPFLIVIAVALGVAAIVGFQLISILYAIIFLPDAPLPPDVTEIEHENFTYGSDRWVYGSSMDGCLLIDFYVNSDGTCVVAPGVCGGNGFATSSLNAQQVGTCDGEQAFSIFGMRWQVSISSGYSVEPITRFELTRDVLWFGLPSEDNPPEQTATPE